MKAGYLLDRIENEVNLDHNMAYKVEPTLWLEVAVPTSDKGDIPFSFIEYLELIKSKAKGCI